MGNGKRVTSRRGNPAGSAAVRWLSLLLFLGVSGPARADSVLGKVVPLPNTVIQVVSPATGRFISPRERPYSVGDQVRKGDPVAIIEHRYNLHDASHLSNTRWDLLGPMLDAQWAAVATRVEREKAERLQELGTMSGQQVQALRAAELVAQAEYAKRKALLDQTDAEIQGSQLVRRGILSPIEGTISEANFTQGQVVNEGVPLFRVTDMDEVGVAARIPESETRRWPATATARIQFDSLPGKVYVGRLETTSPSVDPVSRTREVIFRVENPGENLRFGMIGRVELISP